MPYWHAPGLGCKLTTDAAADILNSIIEKNAQLKHPTDSSTLEGVRKEVDDLARLLDPYVTADPALYRAVADRVTLLGLEYFPWHLLQSKVRKLVVSYNFPPYADASSVTVAKRIREGGVPVDVLAQDMSNIRRADPSLAKIVLPYVRNAHWFHQPPSFSRWRDIVAFTSWGIRTVEAMAKGSGIPYTEIYSRSMFPASHFLAAALKLKYPSLRWTAEFSDPLRHGTDGAERAHTEIPFDRAAMHFMGAVDPDFARELSGARSPFAWCELLPYALADELVFTNDNQLAAMTTGLEKDEVRSLVRKKSTVAHHPTLPEGYYSLGQAAMIPVPGKLHIGYFGEFYANRGLGDAFGAIENLPGHLRELVSLHVFTSDRQHCDKSIKEFGIEENVVVQPSLCLSDFLSTADRFDVLVVNDVQASSDYAQNPYLPSKYSDYKGSSAKIWAIVQPGSVLDGTEVDYKSIQNHGLSAETALGQMIKDKLYAK